MSIAEKLTTVAQNTASVYEAGEAAGRQAESDRFWDMFQDFGKRTAYTHAFSYAWDDDSFKPKYDILAKYAASMFRQSKITDLKGILEDRGVNMIITCEQIDFFAATSNITRCPEIGTALTGISTAFSSCKSLVSIDKLNMWAYGTCNCKSAFMYCEALEEVRFSENISPINLNFQWSPLSYDSLVSLINGLADKTLENGTWMITLGSNNIAKLTDEDIVKLQSKGWEYS